VPVVLDERRVSRSADAFLDVVGRAVGVYRNQPDVWTRMVKRGMSEDLSWGSSATQYVKLYQRLLA